MEILEVKDLTKKFGKTSAVNKISFSLKEGEILGLLGPNGAGKTTTIQMLLGVLTQSSGSIKYFGQELGDNRSKILEYVNFSSTYNDLPHRLTVEEVLHYSTYLYKIKDRQSRINKIKDMFNLESLWKKQIRNLSAGQTTRVGLAKAFVNFPKVLLLDEPTASLDPDVAKYIRKFLLSERKKFNVSIIITSHNMSEVEELCDRVIFISKGRVVADATPNELASEISISHVRLLITDGMKRTIDICKKRKLIYKQKGNRVTIDIDEKQVPYFLKDLLEKGIEYEEISIDRPTLEDYFLQLAGDTQ